MKHINKAGQPQEYSKWRSEMKGKENEDYRNMPSDVRGILLRRLNEEQGYICGYTMRKISPEASHVEHIIPESICRDKKRGSDLDYENVIACYPKKAEKGKTQFAYGAIYKDDWWENDGHQFISPLNPQCELRFSFNIKGEIIPLTNEARKTIEVLCLDHKSLTEDRKRAIKEFIYGPNGTDPLSASKAHQAIQALLQRHRDGSFYVFCVAIQKALIDYLNILSKASARKKFADQSRKKIT